MREIKVRGFAAEEMIGSQWMYGTGIHITTFTDEYAKETGIKEECFVWTESGWIEVHKESIGQYTGLKDKDGREIYEGDILQFEHGKGWSNEYQAVTADRWGWGTDEYAFWEIVDRKYIFEVIGNIYENPELLEVAE